MPKEAVTIYHNPNCSTSKKVLGWLKDPVAHFPAQIDDGIKTNPSTFLLMIIAIFGLGAFFFVVGILSYRGIDIDIDPKTGIRIQRIKIDAPPSA